MYGFFYSFRYKESLNIFNPGIIYKVFGFKDFTFLDSWMPRIDQVVIFLWYYRGREPEYKMFTLIQ